jgi:uncharacterized protein YjeT (DUF2065 family)
MKMWSFVTDGPSAVQMVMLISCVLMGLSHMLQPQIWTEFFARLTERGNFGLVTNAMINSAPGAIIVALHQVWSGPAILLTLYGWALLAKAAMSLAIAPSVGMRALRMSRHGDNAFRYGGIGLLVVGIACGLQLAGIGI